MTEPAKPPAAKQPKPLEDGIRVRMLLFHFQGGVDLPSEQRLARLTTTDVRPDKPRYEITYLPRLGMYHVREFAPWKHGDTAATPKGELRDEFGIPREWALPVWDIS